jgi:hypothetical protein
MNMAQEQTETAPAPTDTWSLTAEQATARLDQMTKQYLEANRPKHDPVAERYQMKGHRIDRLVSGDPKERAKFDALMQAKAEADPVSVGMSGGIGDVPSSEIKQIAVGANWLREVGLPERAVHDFISGAPVEQSFHDQVAAWKSRSMKDGAFVKAYLDKEDAKHSEVVRQMLVANAVLISPIKENAA